MDALTLKAYRDVTRRRVRSLLTLAAILIGVAGVVAIISTGQALARAQADAYSNASQADISFWVWDANPAILRALASLPNITSAELRSQFYTRCQWPDGQWRDVQLYGSDDFANARIDRIFLKEGRWPAEGEFVAERSTRDLLPAQPGDAIVCRAREGGHTETLTLSGFAERPNYPSAALLDLVTVYASSRDVNKLLGTAGSNGVLLKTTDAAQSGKTANDARQLLTRRNLPHDNGQLRDPNNFLGKRELDALLLLLSVFSGVGLLTSGILVTNTLAAIAAEQVGEIGTIKAIGGTRGQVLRVYLVSSAIYGVGGTLLGLLAGVGAAWLLLAQIGRLLNLDTGLTISPLALGLGAALGLGVTMLAGAFPSLAATNIPVKRALEAYGISSTYGRGLIDQLLRKLIILPPLAAMSVRNLARRKGRSFITVLVIAVAVATSLAAQTVSVSVDTALNDLFTTYRADAWVWFGEQVSTAMGSKLEATPGVTTVETWSMQDAWISSGVAGSPVPPYPVQSRAALAGQALNPPYSSFADNGGGTRTIARARLWGVPAETTLYTPGMVAGRWYAAGEPNAVVISTDLAESQGLRVGDPLRIESAGQWRDFQVVGILTDNSVFLGSTVAGKVFMPEAQVASLQRREGLATFFALTFAQHDVTSVESGLESLSQTFKYYAMNSDSAARQVRGAKDQSRLLTVALIAMSLIVGAIGALGVVNTLILNVLERRREIGVLRSIGASDARLIEGFLTEGLVFGLLGWVVGIVLGYPLGLALTHTMEAVLFHIDYVVTLPMIAVSLLFALVLTGGASLVPALAAARLRVSQVLRYE